MRQLLRSWGASVFTASLLVLSGCGGDTDLDGPLLTSITVTGAGTSLHSGATRQLTASGAYADGTTKDITDQVTWSSSDTDNATISSNGMATALIAGTARITASYAYVTGTATLMILPPVPAAAQWAWVDMTAGGAPSEYYSVSVAPDGSVYVTGDLYDSAIHDFGNGVATAASATPGWKAVVAKYDGSGAAQWAVTGDGLFSGISAAPDGSVYAAGSVGAGTSDFGNGVTTALTATSASNVVLVKYDGMGAAQWARTVVAGTTQRSALNSAAAAPDGSVYAAGYIVGTETFDFGNGVSTASTVTSGPFVFGANILLVKYDSAGAAQWARTMAAGSSDSMFTGVTAAPDGSVYATGYMYGTGTYDLGNSVTTTGFTGNRNSILVKYDSSGIVQWVRTVEGIPGTADAGTRTEFSSVSAASDGSVYAAGSIAGMGLFSFGNNVTVDLGTSNIRENSVVVLVKYDPSGTAQWARTVAPGGDIFSSSAFLSISAASDGSVYAGGYMEGPGPYDFGYGVMTYGTGYDDILLVKYSSSGVAQWVKTMVPGTSNSLCYGVSAASDGSVYGAGWINGTGTLDFGDSVSATGNGSDSFFLVKYQ